MKIRSILYSQGDTINLSVGRGPAVIKMSGYADVRICGCQDMRMSGYMDAGDMEARIRRNSIDIPCRRGKGEKET